VNVLFLTDSLGYPREGLDAAQGVDVWPYKVSLMLNKTRDSNKLNLFFDARPGRDSNELVKNRDKHIKAFQADVIVLQIGIVDCYARALTKVEAKVLPALPFIGKLTKYFVKKYYKRIVKFRDMSYVNPSDFRDNLVYFRDGLVQTEFIVLPIAPASDEYRLLNPLIEERVVQYNQILKSVFSDMYIGDCYNEENAVDLFLPDNHHLSRKGHEVVSNKVHSVLMKRCNCEFGLLNKASQNRE